MAERVTQVAIEVIAPLPAGIRTTQVALEVIIPATQTIGTIILDLCLRAGLGSTEDCSIWKRLLETGGPD